MGVAVNGDYEEPTVDWITLSMTISSEISVCVTEHFFHYVTNDEVTLRSSKRSIWTNMGWKNVL